MNTTGYDLSFKLNDSVCSRKTGFPGIGKVVGIMTAHVYAGINRITLEEAKGRFTTWTELYPNWTSLPVIIVYYEEARKNLTWEEAQTFNVSLEDYERLPMTKVVAYVTEDLEKVE